MKKQIYFSILLALSLSVACFAQSPAASPKSKTNPNSQNKQKLSPEEKAVHEANKAEKRLMLSAEQKSKWQAAALSRIQANEPLIAQLQGSTTPGERKILRDRIKSNGLSFDQTITGMLTSEQNGMWTNWKAEKKKNMQKKAKQKNPVEDEFED